MGDIVIVGAVRTPIGAFGGAFQEVSAVDLGRIAVTGLLERSGLDPQRVDEVIMGNVLSAGLGQNPARQMAMGAGIPKEVPSLTLNMVCGSGLRAVVLAGQIIRAGDAECIVCGGAESMSRAPYILPKARWGQRMGDGTLVDSMVYDGLFDIFNNYHMGLTAENVARQWAVSRPDQDAFALESPRRARPATDSGLFGEEIVPVPVPSRRGDAPPVDTDEHPRDTDAEQLAALGTCFDPENGTVTAGNASGLNDGAAALALMDRDAALAAGLPLLATIRSSASVGVDPAVMGIGPVPAIRRALNAAGWTTDDVDLIEIYEAFAAQALAVLRELELDPERVNVNGGAIALGHPIGASGARILVTLLHEMTRRNVARGLAALCIGGGMGTAICIERGTTE